MMTCGSRRSPQSGETAVSSCTASPSVNQRGTRIIGHVEHVDVAHFVPQGAGPVKAAGRPARRAVHRDHIAERHAQRAQAGHAHGAHGEVFVVGIDFHLHRPVELEPVFLLVSRQARSISASK